MIASRNCALAKCLSPRSRCWVFLASGDLEHPVVTTNTDRRRAIHPCAALHILVSSVSQSGVFDQNSVPLRRPLRPHWFGAWPSAPIFAVTTERVPGLPG